MCRYCSDHYGSVVWDMNNSSVEDVCILLGAKDLDVHMIFLDALILCLYQLYVDSVPSNVFHCLNRMRPIQLYAYAVYKLRPLPFRYTITKVVIMSSTL